MYLDVNHFFSNQSKENYASVSQQSGAECYFSLLCVIFIGIKNPQTLLVKNSSFTVV